MIEVVLMVTFKSIGNTCTWIRIPFPPALLGMCLLQLRMTQDPLASLTIGDRISVRGGVSL